jgi:hypothetical protein
MRRITFCDVAMFYCPTGGGIRTYYDAKLDWFRRQHRNRYVLIVPGKRSSSRALTPFVTLVEARGIGMTRREDGYRLFLDFTHILCRTVPLWPHCIPSTTSSWRPARTRPSASPRSRRRRPVSLLWVRTEGGRARSSARCSRRSRSKPATQTTCWRPCARRFGPIGGMGRMRVAFSPPGTAHGRMPSLGWSTDTSA